MKKTLLFVLCFSVFLDCIPAFAASDRTYTNDIYTYAVSGKTCTILNVDDSQSVVEIPEKLGNFTVTALGDGAMGGCTVVEEVVIPKTVTKIGDFCFAYSNSLQKVTIPEGVVTISDGAFYHCEGLWTVALPRSVKTIGKNAFGRCSSLTALSIPGSVTQIGENAFPTGNLFRLYGNIPSVSYTYALQNEISFEEYITVTVNGKEVIFDQPSVTNTEYYRTMVPMRAVLEALGGTLTWDNTFNTAGINVMDTRILIRPDEPFMMINGTVRYLSCPAMEYNGRVMVPIRDIIEAIGGKVKWDETNKLVAVTVQH